MLVLKLYLIYHIMLVSIWSYCTSFLIKNGNLWLKRKAKIKLIIYWYYNNGSNTVRLVPVTWQVYRSKFLIISWNIMSVWRPRVREDICNTRLKMGIKIRNYGQQIYKSLNHTRPINLYWLLINTVSMLF